MSHSGGRDRRKKDNNNRDNTPKADVRVADKPQSNKGKPRLGESLPASEEPATKYMQSRTLYMLANLVGRVVQVQVKGGAIYEGIFHTATTDKGMGVILKMAKKKDTPITTAPLTTLVIQPKDFVQLIAKDVVFDMDETLESVGDEGAFHTDTDISGHLDVRERELTPWAPDEGLESNLSNTFEVERGWDQFEVNEKLFGVKTSYQEELYTTTLDRSARGYAERAEEARRIADEIEGRAAEGNIHLAEERGQMHTGSEEMDEEDRYSSVIRSDKYVPPAKRSSRDVKDAKSADKGKKEKEPPRLEKERSSNSLNSSTEDLGRFLPTSPGKDKNNLNERIRLRLHIVNEKYKNSVPVTVPDTQLPEGPRSPLLSPLVGNAKAINALNLEPCSPNLPEEVVRDFLEFSLTERAKGIKKSRESVTEQLKSFSRDLTSRTSRPGSPLTMSPSPSPLGGSTSSTAEFAQQSSPALMGSAPPTSVTAAPTPVSTPAAATATVAPVATPSATTTATSTPIKPVSKLNPNAKVFTPMSANAPVFTPKSFVPPVQHVAPVEPMYFQPVAMPMPAVDPPRNTNALDLNESVNDVYCEALKKKHTQSPDSAKTTVPYWMGPRGSYRNIAEEELFYYTQHPMGGPAAPRHPMGGVVGMAPVAVAPMAPVPGMNPMAMNLNMNLPPGAYPPQYVGVIPTGVAPIPIPAQPQPVPPGATPIYSVPHQPGVRPFQPMQPGMGGAPMQPGYVYTPGMPPHTPSGPPHYQPPVYTQPLPHSPQTPPQMAVPQKRYYPHMSPQQQPILMPHSPHSPSPAHPPQVYPSPPPNTSPSRPLATASPAGTPPSRP